MKKQSFILLASLAIAGMGMVSCSEESGFVEPAVNPQLPAVTAGDITVSAEWPASIDLTAYNNSGSPIAVGKVTVKNLPADNSLEVVAQIGRDTEFSHSATFPVEAAATETAGEYNLSVNADDLEGAYIEAIGKSAKTKTVFFRAHLYAVNGTSKVLLGQPDAYVLAGSSSVTPLDLGIVIEESYGVLGTINGWSVADAVLFDHEGDDVYDNPIFTMIVNISVQQANDGWWWKVVPQSTIETGNWVDAANASFGTQENGSDALEGNLVPRTDTWDCGAGCVKEPGVYKLVLDMENQTYEFVPQYDYLYIPGDPNGWNHAAAARLVSSIGGTSFQGFAALNGSFKFTDQPGWSGTNYGAADEAGKLSTDGGAGNLSVDTEGLYFAKVDTDKLTYSLTPITSVGLIGDFNGWGSQQAMTSSDNKVWTGTLTVTDGQGWKVRMNDNWDINLGGDLKNLTFGGDNIVVPAGTYTVTLDLSDVPYTITLK